MLEYILAVCSTAVGIVQLVLYGDGATITALVGFWGVLLGREVQKQVQKNAG